jgi:hypothetical protein
MKYFLGHVGPSVELTQFATAREADAIADDWLEMEALTLEEAKAGYEQAFDEWEKRNGCYVE